MGEDQALREALEVAQRQLAAAEGELREVRERVHNLRSVVYGLKQIFEPGDVDGPGEARSKHDGVRFSEVSAGTARRREEPSLALRRAAQVLSDAGRPMRMLEITNEWQKRGWVDPGWKAPKSAINMIYQRALKAGLVGRMPDRSWVLRSAVAAEFGRNEFGGGGVQN
ncbi:HTH domain-containing protein [Streptomyces erythrochromogenes]|uniref:HTH domain-containing protein n=1 Tax=Streptomyces erythrochromogenes TaxID=285574 RepID=UPI0038303556